MARNAVTIEIARPPEAVFPWLVEADRLARWMGGFKDRRPLTEGGIKVGARSIDTFEIGGRRHEVEAEIATLEPPHYLACRLSIPNEFDSKAVYSLSEEAGFTVVHLIQDTEYVGLVAWLMSWITIRSTQKKLEADFVRLRDSLEAS